MFAPKDSTGSYVKGKFTNSVFHDNVMVDSGWISLLQVNNTKLCRAQPPVSCSTSVSCSISWCVAQPL